MAERAFHLYLPEDAAQRERTPDPINHPEHYARLNPEPIDVIEAWGLDFLAGNVVKYVARHPFKGTPVEDLKKARFYLDRAIARLEAQRGKLE
ncbi:MAG: DUF3310 domain-containing protein [Dehalococcoidia bacterium]|nr:MAG: DUF3310 domain-containing protein [Dehalococcoidia bacterium]